MAANGGARQLDYVRLHARVVELHEAVRSADARVIHQKILRDGNPHALGLFGRTAARYHATALAIRLLENAVARGADKAEDWNELGLAYLAARRFDEAVSRFEQARLREPDQSLFVVNIALALQEQGAFDDALAMLDELGSPHAQETPVLLRRAELHLYRREPESALAALALVRGRERNATRRLSLEALAHSQRNDAEAFADLMRFDEFLQQIELEVPPGYSSRHDFNRSLRKYVAKHRALVVDPDGYSTRKGRHSLGNLLRDRCPVIDALDYGIKRAVEGYVAALPESDGHPFLARANDFRVEAWAVMLGREGHHVSHIHRDGWLSGVYYVDVADVVRCEDPRREGWLELGRGPTELQGGAEMAVDSAWVCPQDGVFVLFPSYCWHRTNAILGSGERVAIAFDLIPDD